MREPVGLGNLPATIKGPLWQSAVGDTGSRAEFPVFDGETLSHYSGGCAGTPWGTREWEPGKNSRVGGCGRLTAGAVLRPRLSWQIAGPSTRCWAVALLIANGSLLLDGQGKHDCIS